MLPEPALIIRDNFYDDPNDVREFAIASEYRRVRYTSTNSLASRERHPEAINTLRRIARLVNAVPDIDAIEAVHSFWGFAACGEFQLRTRDHALGPIHCHARGQWAAVLYLTDKDACQGKPGTIFYGHTETGTSRFTGGGDLEYAPFRRDALTPGAWTQLCSVPMVFNRLLLFDSRYFHAESHGFGTGAHDGRLVQIFNFVTL
jgi:hypothetical protein